MLQYTIGASPRSLMSCKPHLHDSWELVANLDGEGTATIGEHTYPFSSGTIMVIPPQTVHSKESTHGLYDVYLHTDELSPELGIQTFSCFQDDGNDSFGQLFRLLLQCHHQQNAAAVFLYRALLELLGTRLQAQRSRQAVTQLKNLLVADFSDPDLQLVNAMQNTGYASDHLRRLFTEEVGMTPSAYLRQLRITFACELLAHKANSRLSVADIAHMCGYHDEKYFSRIFLKIQGLTPLQYAQRSIL